MKLNHFPNLEKNQLFAELMDFYGGDTKVAISTSGSWFSGSWLQVRILLHGWNNSW